MRQYNADPGQLSQSLILTIASHLEIVFEVRINGNNVFDKIILNNS